ncbi:hypothetical protein [Propylenella binzhouense]|uniref:Uncharacterized protein n=1 Tax=Propylenella binzhouense TaxID=2555902 RepID=A0A964T297_9HYPH|nr:hypothetical protein [Propylenella binzhouense]MYZ47083.1 hypothetical protein [Propylenella binzhouense]
MRPSEPVSSPSARERILPDVLLGIVLLGVLILGFEAFHQELLPGVRLPAWLAYAGGALLALLVGIVAYWIREEIRPRPLLYPVCEIVLGCFLATQALHPDNEVMFVRVLSFAAGVLVIVDGLKRYRAFDRVRRHPETGGPELE